MDQIKRRFGKSSDRHDAVDLDLFLFNLEQLTHVSKACAETGCSKAFIYKYKSEHPEFQAAWDAAIKHRWETIENDAIRRAHEGWPSRHETTTIEYDSRGREKKKTTVAVNKLEFSPALLMFMLKANLGAKYHLEKKEAEAAGDIGAQIVNAVRAMQRTVPDVEEKGTKDG